MNGFEKVIIAMGLFAFAKQAPKLIGDVLGIDSGNIKLGIMGKLAAGGGLGLIAAAGGAATTFVRNAAHGYGRSKESWNNFKETEGQGWQARAKAFGRALGATTFGWAGSIAAGSLSGGVRGLKGGINAKNSSDVVKAAGEAAKNATQARDHRESYRASHGGYIGAMTGHISDALHNAQDWAGGGFASEEAVIKFDNQVLDQNSKLKSATEDLRKKNGDNEKLLEGLAVNFSKNAAEQARYEKMFSQFSGMNLNTIREYINQQKSTTLNRNDFMVEHQIQQNGELITTKIFDDVAFTNAMQNKAKNEAELEKMLKDVEKAADMRIQTAAFNEATATAINIDANKLSDIKNNMTQINDLLSSAGKNKVNTNMIVTNQNEIGNALKDIITNIEVERNNKAAEVERKKRAREQRQSNKNNNSK